MGLRINGRNRGVDVLIKGPTKWLVRKGRVCRRGGSLRPLEGAKV